jgi:glycosyltransferase involved in cell wall biosynthesis
MPSKAGETAGRLARSREAKMEIADMPQSPSSTNVFESQAMSPTTHPELSVILVSPNVSEQMGGEAIKALQILLELKRQGIRVHQITHDRVKSELDRNFPGIDVSYVKDTRLERILCRIKPLAPSLNIIFLWRATRLARSVSKRNPGSVIHFTSPVSPVLPYFRIPGSCVVIGPINGNIHYPAPFRPREPLSYRLRRWLHPILQFLNRHSVTGKQHADALLVAGGERTYKSLRMGGCRDEQFVDSIDSGVLDRLDSTPRICHAGMNLHFFQNGRLVHHKGTDLVIKALKKTRNPIEFDIIGRGPELENLKTLTAALNLRDRVHFVEWIPDHSKVAETLRKYRAFVFPSLAEANGIVVQEAMVQGLPVIALNWGGPSLLVTRESGVLIEPISEEHVVTELANAMDLLAADGELAERMSIAGRKRAEDCGYLWSRVIRDWISVYHRVYMARRGKTHPVLV